MFLTELFGLTQRSSGYMCVKGWQIDRFNPAKIPVITREMEHKPEFLDLRGGPKTAGISELSQAYCRSCRHSRSC
jgi:hypothetical protein